MLLLAVLLLKVFSTYIAAEYIELSTKGDGVLHNTHKSGVDVKAAQWIHFRVRGCHDCIIKLFSTSDFEGADNANIVLGGWNNDKCVMSPCNGCAQTYSELYPFLSCDEYRPMWLNWTDNTLSIGTGSYVGENTFMSSREDRSFGVNYLALSSKWNAHCVWQFFGPGGNYYKRISPSGISSRPRISTNMAASLWECTRLCLVTRACKTVNYHPPSSTCHLTAEKPRQQDIEVEPTWEIWCERKM